MSFPVGIFSIWCTPLLCLGFALCTAIFAILCIVIPRSSISKLRGPPSQSWFLGNIKELESSPVGYCEFRWADEFGSSYRLKGGYGEDIFVSSDPRALQFLLQTSGYNVVKLPSVLQRAINIVGGSTILSTEGPKVHKRHRRVLLPAFGLPETKALVHVFQSKASKLMNQWKAEMKGSDSFEINVYSWLTKATLDTIGEAAFDYQFRALDGHETKLGKVYQGLSIATIAYFSHVNVAWRNFIALLPRSLVWLTDVRIKSKKQFLATRGIARGVAGELLDKKRSISGSVNEDKRDVMSLLGTLPSRSTSFIADISGVGSTKAISTEDNRARLTRMEVIDQMGAIILAGRNTVASALSWSLWELSKNHVIQDKLREEIMMYSQQYSDDIIPASEYVGMEYTVAFIKEVLRMHPNLPIQIRQAAKDLVVPLHDPIMDKDRKEANEVLLKKGMRIFINIAAYQRHPVLWGPDPHTFCPKRWLNMKESKVRFGVYGNLGVFGAGIHACIGWRFALYQLQSFLITTMQNFKIVLPDKAPKVRRTLASMMVPQVEGDDKHICIPLKITVLKS